MLHFLAGVFKKKEQIDRCESRNKKMEKRREKLEVDAWSIEGEEQGRGVQDTGLSSGLSSRGEGGGGLSWPGSQYLTALNR